MQLQDFPFSQISNLTYTIWISILGPLPYAITSNATSHQQDISSNKLYDEIPFQFSPTYNMIWLNGSTVKRKPKMLKEIDWDSLCYDFTLEKSILQS